MQSSLLNIIKLPCSMLPGLLKPMLSSILTLSSLLPTSTSISMRPTDTTWCVITKQCGAYL